MGLVAILRMWRPRVNKTPAGRATATDNRSADYTVIGAAAAILNVANSTDASVSQGG
jgi:hypothetical protein